MTRFVIEEDNVMYKDVITRTPVDLMPSIEKAFQSNITVKIKNVVDFSQMGEPFYGFASICAASSTPETTWWSVRVKTLNLNTQFKLDKVQQLLVPVFISDGGDQMEIPWRMPDDMTVVLGITVVQSNRGFKLGKYYLAAYDQKGATWRLPLCNLYDHLELCHGQEHGFHPTAMKALLTGLAQFRSSAWNSDLNGQFQQRNAPLMFRFKPVNSGFEQLPIETATWTVLCQKVSNELVNSKLQPV